LFEEEDDTYEKEDAKDNNAKRFPKARFSVNPGEFHG
jgi:hypothetical protein